MNWELFTGFVGGSKHCARLNGDRRNAWAAPIEGAENAYRWTVEDNVCGKVLDFGYADDLETAKREAEESAERMGLI
ncbi:hypothetical protein PBI_GAIA_156 [Mycobacterium phage Gaia]|uniref:Uncharacterized protein n=1 Tax=Mycobacterium phage Gaia TaxID=1486472 RepID=A0A068F1Z4_9CAUD|nr:hypothetical protein VC46_gp080 [Mycobacterium phage Gaia]AID58972.1 hypothetical protein PBI_GAIA_156 [Mycobacterium phage Gaia]